MLAYLYVLQDCRVAMSTDSWQVFGLCWFWCSCLSLWWMCGLVVWYLKLSFFPLHTLQWRMMCWRLCEGGSCQLHARGVHHPWICHRGIWATVFQSVLWGLQWAFLFQVFLLFENKKSLQELTFHYNGKLPWIIADIRQQYFLWWNISEISFLLIVVPLLSISFLLPWVIFSCVLFDNKS